MWEGGNLNNCTFSGWGWVAFDPRGTRGRPAKNTREMATREILTIVLFWQRRGVYQCTSRFYKLTRARTYIVLENDWYTGTVVSEEWESDNRALVFWGCLLPHKAHASCEWRGIKNLARAMPSQRKGGFIRRIVGAFAFARANPRVRAYRPVGGCFGEFEGTFNEKKKKDCHHDNPIF